MIILTRPIHLLLEIPLTVDGAILIVAWADKKKYNYDNPIIPFT